jgi:allophanate hydrolase subunit 1
MILRYPQATPHGDTGVAIEFGDRIDEAINASVLALDRLVADNPIQGMIEAVPTYRSLMIHYDPVETSFERISTDVLTLARSVQHVIAVDRLLTIPVCYGGEFGIDLDSVAAALSVDADEVVRRHSAQTYRVYMRHHFHRGRTVCGACRGRSERLALDRPQPYAWLAPEFRGRLRNRAGGSDQIRAGHSRPLARTASPCAVRPIRYRVRKSCLI